MKRYSTNRGLTARYLCYQLLFAIFIITPIRCFVPERIPSSLSSTSNNHFPNTKAAASRSTTRTSNDAGNGADGRHRRMSASISASVSISSSRLAAGRTRDDADLLPLSSFDRKKFHHMKTRGRVMPIIVLGEPLVPGQRLFFRSGDPKFEELIKYIAQIERDYADSSSSSSGAKSAPPAIIEIGILGFNPQSGQPLSIGVTAQVKTRNFAYSLTAENRDRAITTSFKGARIFRLVGDPWMDPTGSFHMAHVEVFDERYDDDETPAQRHTQIESDKLFAQIPALVDDWMELMFEGGLATPASLIVAQRQIIAPKHHQQEQHHQTKDNQRGPHPYPRPRSRNNNYALYPPMRQTDRTVWVAALLNPIQRYPVRVSNEIRPAFLACRNDRDRLTLCVTALRTSLGFLETYVDAKRKGGLGKDGKGVDGSVK